MTTVVKRSLPAVIEGKPGTRQGEALPDVVTTPHLLTAFEERVLGQAEKEAAQDAAYRQRSGEKPTRQNPNEPRKGVAG